MHITELDSFKLSDAVKFHNRLNPKIWGRDEHLLPEVREKLMAIAENFREFLGVGDLDVKDITISGSNAAYSYTPYSDIDLHLVVEFPADNEVYQELFNAKKYQYNDEHNLAISGVPVELYVQNAAESPVSQGEYSISRDEWVQVPRRKRARVDDTCVRAKVEDVDARIHSAIRSGNAEHMGRLWDKIKTMRQSGLDEHGEFGCENIVFKVLRNKGCIKELRAARTAAQDHELSLREQDHAPQFHWGFAEGHQGQPYSSPDGVAASTEMFLNEDDTESMVQQFIQDTAKRLGIERMPEIQLHDNDGWSEQNHSFGMYQPELHVLHVNMRNRHIMDILRTVAHELAHCRQNEIEQLSDDAGATGSPVENEANAVAGIIMRDFADAHPELFDQEAITEAADPLAIITQATIENAKRFKALQNTGLKLLPFGKAPNGNAVYIYDNSARPTVVVDMGGFTVPFYNSSGLGGKETVAAGNWYPFFGLGPIEGWINKGSQKDINEFYGSEKLKKVANILNATLGRPLRDKTHMMGWSAFPGDYSQFVAVVNKGLSPVDDVEPFDTNGWIKNVNSLLLKVGGKQYKAKATTPATAPAATPTTGATKPATAPAATPTTGATKPAVGTFPGEDPQGPGYVGRREVARRQAARGATTSKPATPNFGQQGGGYAKVNQPTTMKYSGVPMAKPAAPAPTGSSQRDKDYYDGLRAGGITDKELFGHETVAESSGYIPTWAERNDPRFEMALSVDVHPGQTGTEANKMRLETDAQGHPQLLRADGKVSLSESLAQEFELFEEQDLFEINMGSKNLRREAAKTGAIAGMEFEMIVPGIKSDDPEQEPDYDQDQRCRSIDDAVNFFHDGDYNGRRDVERLRERMQEDFLEWLDDKLDNDWNSRRQYHIRDWVADNVDDSEWRDAVNDNTTEQEAFDKFASNVLADPSSDYYQQAYDEYREENQDNYDESDWLDAEDLDVMSGVEQLYGMNWPHWTSMNSGEIDADQVADEFSRAVGREVRVNTRYHQSGDRPGPNNQFYIVEPDASLDGDSPGDEGLEFVSPPMPIDELLKDLNAVKEWAGRMGVYTNQSTGLHINISVPEYSKDRLDFVKLALLLGDEYVLDLFGRASNTYAKSALGKVRDRVRQRPEEAQQLLDKMKGQMGELASKAIHGGYTDKYTSINTKDGHIEFRSPGGDWLDDNFDKIENTLLRFTVAMSAALNPEAYREEYQKKLYKLLTQDQKGSDTIKYFADYVAGKIPRAALRSFVKQAQLERRVKRGETSNQKMWWSVTNPPQSSAGIEVVATSKEEAIEKALGPDGYPSWANTRQSIVAKPVRPYEGKSGNKTYELYNTQTDETVPDTDFTVGNDADVNTRLQDYINFGQHGMTAREAGLIFSARPVGTSGNTSSAFTSNTGSQTDMENRMGIGSQSADANWEIVSRITGRPVFLMIANDQDEANRKYGDWLAAAGLHISTNDFGYRRRDSGGRPNDPNGRYAIVPRSDPVLYGQSRGVTPDYQFRFNMGNPAEQAQGRYILQAWAARNNVVPADYMVVDTEQWDQPADAEQGGIIDIEPDVAQALPGSTADLAQQRTAPGTFSGAWKILVNGEEVHRFSGVGNSQSDANRVAAQWLRDNGRGVSGEGFEVYPIMTEGLTEGKQFNFGNFIVTLGPHAIDRTIDRKVDPKSVEQILQNINQVRSSIMGQPVGAAFILHDGNSTALGVRRHDANRLTLATVYPIRPGFTKGKHPTFQVDVDQQLAESASDYEIHDRPKLDRVLAKCCRMVVKGQQRDPERYGQVAACVIDPDNRMIYGINLPAKDGTRRHAERVAIDKYRKSIGEIPAGSIIVTTCSPCNSPMEERHGESCKDLLNSVGIHKVYAGYQDPTQHDDRDADFRVYVTENDQLWGECQLFAQTFLGVEELAEDFQEPVNEILKITPFQMGRSNIDTDNQGIKSANKLPGGSGLLYKINDENFRVTISIYDPQKQGKNPVGRQIGILTLSPGGWYLPIESSLRVNMIAVDPQYRAQGIAKAMYGLVLTKMKRTLVAGDSQSPGGRKNWVSLAQIPGVSVKGYVAIDNRLLDSRIDTIMGKLGGEYIGSDLSNRKFFAFDVLPGTNELKPAVVTSLNKIYSGALSTGLYATWSGTVNEQDIAEENFAEAFDQPYKGKWEKSEYGLAAELVKLPDGSNLSIIFDRKNAENDTWSVEFWRNNNQRITGQGDAQRVFATVLTAIQKFIKENKPQKLFFDANTEFGESRAKLYDRLVQRYTRAWGYRAFRADYRGDMVRYELSRLQPVAENFADGILRANEFIVESDERAIAQAQYMQGECAVLAITIHKMDPQRFPLGFVYEFFDSMPDIYIEPDEFDELDPARQQDIQNNHQNWSLTHAYVFDQKTQKYIDARGSHDSPPNIGHHFNATRHNKFPAEIQDLVNVSSSMEWDEAQEKWIVLRGWDALDKAYTPEDQQRAREYAIKYLGVGNSGSKSIENENFAEELSEGENPVKFTVTTPDGYTHSFQITLAVHGKHVGHFNFVRGADTDDVNNEAEVESRWQGQGYGKLLLMKAIDVANNHGLDFQQDIRGITNAQQNVYDSLENAGSIVTPGDGFWFLTPQGEQELTGLNENFADGRNPQDKGDSKRYGVPTKASVSTLRKVAKQGGRKGQLSHWMANMKAGRAKAKRNK